MEEFELDVIATPVAETEDAEAAEIPEAETAVACAGAGEVTCGPSPMDHRLPLPPRHKPPPSQPLVSLPLLHPLSRQRVLLSHRARILPSNHRMMERLPSTPSELLACPSITLSLH